MIGIIDTGHGNIIPIEGAYAELGIRTERIVSASQVSKQSHIILPGVGSFDETMDRYHQLGLCSAIKDAVAKNNVRLLGICVGLQIMCMSSEEGHSPGLALINASVKKLSSSRASDRLLLPHMGWNTLNQRTNHPLIDGINPRELEFFFLHSYYVSLLDEDITIATCTYGAEIPSMIASGTIYGTQFHPEKSHSQGLQLLKNFANL